MEIELAFLCEAATVSQEGKLNILGVFDTIGGDKFPLKFHRIILVASLLGEPQETGKHPLEVRFIAPDGEGVVSPLKMEIEIPPGGGRARVISELNNFTLKIPGPYSFEILSEDKSLKTIPLEVVQRPRLH